MLLQENNQKQVEDFTVQCGTQLALLAKFVKKKKKPMNHFIGY